MITRDDMAKRQKALGKFGEFALASDDLDAVLAEACRLVADACGTRRAKILEMQDDGRDLLVRAGVGWNPGIIGRLRLKMSEHSSESFAIDAGVPVICRDIAHEDRFEFPDFMTNEGVRALVNVPIFLPGRRAYGLLQVDDIEPRQFVEEDTEFLRTYATLLGPVIDRLEKVEHLHKAEERFRLVVSHVRDYAIILTSRDNIITDWLPGAEAVFGWTAEEAVGQPGSLIFTPDDREHREPQKEIETAREHGSVPDVRWHMHKDGRRIFINGFVTALYENGEVAGFLKIGQDITQKRADEARLRENRRRLQAVIQGIPQLVWRAESTGFWTWVSPQWTQYTGQSVEESRGWGWLDALHPEDRERAQADWGRADGSSHLDMETRLFHTGEQRYRWFQTRALPVRGEDGQIIEWLGTSTDVDDLRQLQEAQSVMVAELQHRTRNLIGVVRAMANKTFSRSTTLEGFKAEFGNRMDALSRVQGLLSRSGEERVTIGDLVHLELEALGADMGERVWAEGPAVPIRKTIVQTLSLALHELATNARKYGALAGDEGHLSVRWTTHRENGEERRLHVEWIESGVPNMPAPEDAPKGGGYGRHLIEKALPYQLKARTRYELTPDGVHCTIDLPLTAR